MISQLEISDPERAKALSQDVLFYVRQKHQDLLTQLAVSIQSYLAIDIIIKNNIELIKGVDRASTTTISALRTAVIVAQALGNQKLVLDQITALNTTTSDLIQRTSEMLRDNSAQIQQQAASATIGLPQLQAAFQNIYATMDSIDTFKMKALDTMAATIGTLENEVVKSREYLDRVNRQDQQLATGALDLSATAVPRPVCADQILIIATVDQARLTTIGCLHGFQGLARQDHRAGSSSAPAAGWSTNADRSPVRRVRHRRPRPTSWRRWTGSRRWSAGGVVPAVGGSPGWPRSVRPSGTPCPGCATSGSAASDAYSVMATATDYLPEAIGGYTRLPRQWADSRPIENGKTSLMLLIDQLDLLGGDHGQDLRRRRPGRRRRPDRARTVPAGEVRPRVHRRRP